LEWQLRKNGTTQGVHWQWSSLYFLFWKLNSDIVFWKIEHHYDVEIKVQRRSNSGSQECKLSFHIMRTSSALLSSKIGFRVHIK
jgi:hypothetical protein